MDHFIAQIIFARILNSFENIESYHKNMQVNHVNFFSHPDGSILFRLNRIGHSGIRLLIAVI